MALFRKDFVQRRHVISLLWFITFIALSEASVICSPTYNPGWQSTLSWLLMLMGIYSFYSGLFRFYDWYNKP